MGVTNTRTESANFIQESMLELREVGGCSEAMGIERPGTGDFISVPSGFSEKTMYRDVHVGSKAPLAHSGLYYPGQSPQKTSPEFHCDSLPERRARFSELPTFSDL